MNKVLKIALDYDETFTSDRSFWSNFVILSKISNHQIVFVTYRTNREVDNNSDIESDAITCGINVIYSQGQPKRTVFDADIWIDDSPETIVELDDVCFLL